MKETKKMSIKHTNKRQLNPIRNIFILLFLLLFGIGVKAQVITFTLGEKELVTKLYPTPGTNGYPDTTAEIVKDFLEMSLNNDGVSFNSVDVSLAEKGSKANYQVKIDSTDPQAVGYEKMMPPVFHESIGGQALNGVNACKDLGQICWNPLRGFGEGYHESKWDIFMPLGLPMVNQKIIMLLHYPPYVSLQDHDYLKNNTMYRWERMLESVGVPKSEVVLYESIVDINPIAAPGSGQSAFLPIMMATNYFDYPAAGRDYITPMMAHMIDPPSNSSTTHTVPVIVFGGEATGFWRVKYRYELPKDYKGFPVFTVLSHGDLKVTPDSTKKTAYFGANHPIAAVYQTCNSYPGIIEMEKQDLVTACFTKKLGENPAMNTQDAFESCEKQWMKEPTAEEEKKVCINSIIDMSNYGSCSWEQAGVWCAANNNDVCGGAAMPQCIDQKKEK